MIWWTSGFLSRSRSSVVPGEMLSGTSQVETSTGPSPAPISVRPFLTASEATFAAARAARTGRSPLASSAASVAEWVQPAPCVAGDVVPGHRNLVVLDPVVEVVDRLLAVSAGDDDRGAQLVQALRQLAARRSRPIGEHLGLTEVRRHDRREREQPPDEHVDSVVLEELRARARDHHGIDDERHPAALQRVSTVSIAPAENSIPVLAASTPMSSKTASICARMNSGGSS